jgi:nitrate/TMAO reductase-like tetraheme cytochrome c subunit
VACHDNIHDRQFEKDGITDCTRCHSFDAWKPGSFDHSTARFQLEGAHKEVACIECHKPEMVEGKKVIQYNLRKFKNNKKYK